MSRIIKFRVWDGGSMFYPSYNLQASNCDTMGDPCLSQGLANCGYITSDAKIQQFTGLKDKNGREIYEGDILSIGHFLPNNALINVKIIFKDGMFMMQDRLESRYLIDSWDFAIKNEQVIGNIFENPELLSI